MSDERETVDNAQNQPLEPPTQTPLGVTLHRRPEGVFGDGWRTVLDSIESQCRELRAVGKRAIAVHLSPRVEKDLRRAIIAALPSIRALDPNVAPEAADRYRAFWSENHIGRIETMSEGILPVVLDTDEVRIAADRDVVVVGEPIDANAEAGVASPEIPPHHSETVRDPASPWLRIESIPTTFGTSCPTCGNELHLNLNGWSFACPRCGCYGRLEPTRTGIKLGTVLSTGRKPNELGRVSPAEHFQQEERLIERDARELPRLQEEVQERYVLTGVREISVADMEWMQSQPLAYWSEWFEEHPEFIAEMRDMKKREPDAWDIMLRSLIPNARNALLTAVETG